jgi:WD40 repeat protein
VYETGDLSMIKETESLPAEKQPVSPLKPFTDPAVKPLCTFEGQQGAVYALSFNHGGTHVASAGFDGVVRINDAQSGKLIKEFVAVPLRTDEPVASNTP